MRKVILLLTTAGYLASGAVALAQENVSIKQPGVGLNSQTNLGTIIGNVITVIIVVAALAVLFMLIFGAFEWITSGGDKEAIAKARGRIINALIGLAILAIAFVIVRVISMVVNINILNLVLPKLDA